MIQFFKYESEANMNGAIEKDATNLSDIIYQIALVLIKSMRNLFKTIFLKK